MPYNRIPNHITVYHKTCALSIVLRYLIEKGSIKEPFFSILVVVISVLLFKKQSIKLLNRIKKIIAVLLHEFSYGGNIVSP